MTRPQTVAPVARRGANDRKLCLAAKPGDAVPDTVLAKEEHLKAQIASLRNALAKEKAK